MGSPQGSTQLGKPSFKLSKISISTLYPLFISQAEHHVSSPQGSTQLGMPSFKLSANKFLTLPDEQWRATALGRRPEQAKKGNKRCVW